MYTHKNVVIFYGNDIYCVCKCQRQNSHHSYKNIMVKGGNIEEVAYKLLYLNRDMKCKLEIHYIPTKL